MTISAISSTVSAQAFGGGKASGALEGQLAKFEVQLSDWTHCPSCTTPEGKAKIAEIGDKIKDIQQQIAASDKSVKSVEPANISSSPRNLGENPPSSRQSTGMVGSQLNVFA